MALIYVRSGAASPTAPYSTWATAAGTLLDAITNASPTSADTIWLAPDHAESTAIAQVWVCPTTPGLRIMCAASNTVAPPTGLAQTATITTTGNSNQQITGFAYVYGVNFNCGTTGNPSLIFGNSATTINCGVILERCGLALLTTGTAALMQFGNLNVAGFGAAAQFKMIDCTIRFSAVQQYMRLYAARLEIQRLSFHASSVVPTTVFYIGSVNTYSVIEIRGCDLSTKAYTNLFNVNAISNPSIVTVRNSLLASGGNIYTGTLTLPGSQVFRIHDSSVTSPYFNFSEHSVLGVVSSELVVRRTDGAEASDSTTYSIKMSGSTTATELYPLRTPEISIWNDIIDTPLNIVMEILADRVSNLKDNEVWMEVAHPDDADNSLYNYTSDGRASQMATAADQTASTAVWTTTGITNIKKQKLEVTIVASKIGFINVRACLALNTIVYVDTPTITE